VGPRALGTLVAVTLAFAFAACGGDDQADLAAAREFDGFSLLWVGERFEDWHLEHVEVPGPGGFATLIYGDCKPQGGDEPSCAPPLQLQIQPLCTHLAEVTRAPIWQRRSIRGAPVGTIDSAPVLLTETVQVKAYRGEGSDAELAWRALGALRSLNGVEPVIAAGDPIPPPSAGVLEGTRPCSG
jgi:hypothetical protein